MNALQRIIKKEHFVLIGATWIDDGLVNIFLRFVVCDIDYDDCMYKLMRKVNMIGERDFILIFNIYSMVGDVLYRPSYQERRPFANSEELKLLNFLLRNFTRSHFPVSRVCTLEHDGLRIISAEIKFMSYCDIAELIRDFVNGINLGTMDVYHIDVIASLNLAYIVFIADFEETTSADLKIDFS
jgi:hypothetical protein